MSRDLAPERPGDTLLEIYRDGRAIGWTRRALPAASARPAVLPSYCFSPIKMAAAALSPAPRASLPEPLAIGSHREPGAWTGQPEKRCC